MSSTMAYSAQSGTSPLPLPPIMHHPPQIFGAYGQDGSPLPPYLSDAIFFDPLGPGAGEPDAKRQRIARACDMCRKKKIKCDAKSPACSHCLNYKTECVFTHVEKKRAPPKGPKYIEALERRVARLESLLRIAGILPDDDIDKVDLAELEKQLTSQMEKQGVRSLRHSDPRTSTDEPSSPAPTPRDASAHGSEASSPRSRDPSAEAAEKRTPDEVEALSEMMCSLVTNNCGETRYIGSSSGFSIFSPKGIQWVNDRTGDRSFQRKIFAAVEDDNKWIHWKPEVFGDIFRRRVYMPLPPKEEALSLLKDYFENFNCMFPLFHEPTFRHYVNLQYSDNPYDGSGWWASFNVVLAIAHRLRVMSNLVPHEEDQMAWGYLKNALGVITELTIRNTDLLSIQALLGMSLFLQGTPNQQPSFFLVAAAIRIAHSIGLHKRGSGFNLMPAEVEQRKRVFWIAYLVDKDLCLRSGRPPAQDDDDMNVDLPDEDPPDNIGNIPLADGKGKINLFRLMCTFAVIENKVYKQLYSTKASRQSDGELLRKIGELDRELEEWKDGIPLDFRPEYGIKASHTPLILHVVVLHFAYYNCLITIHRMAIHHGYWTSRLSNYALQGLNARPLNPRVYSSATICVSAARSSINLLPYIPQGDHACVWLILYFPVSALVTVFANILENPHDTRAREDVKLMEQVVNFLSMLSVDENGGVRRMLGVCSEFERIAKAVLDRAEKEAASKRKRKTPEASSKISPRPFSGPALTPPQQAKVAMARSPFTPRQSFDVDRAPSILPSNAPLATANSSWPQEPSSVDGAATLLTPPSGQTPAFVEAHADSPNAGVASADPVVSHPPFVPQHFLSMHMMGWDLDTMNTLRGPLPFPPESHAGSHLSY